MIYAGLLILVFTAVQFLIALVNLVFLQPLPKKSSRSSELVSVLIPARNEANNIKNLLKDLQQQNYPHIEVIVFNDQSTDGTEQILKQFTAESNHLHYFNSEGLPEGWLGKNYVCHSLAMKAKGNYLLFLDADVRIGGQIIEQMLSFSKQQELTLLSIFPTQKMITTGEKATVPNMNFILLTLLPLILVRKSHFPSLAAANGQCMFFLKDDYNDLLPHKTMRSSMAEDIETAKYLKGQHKRVACLTGNINISCRMYSSYNEAMNGFSKNVLMFFNKSYFLAIAFWLVTTFGFVAVYFSFSLSVFFIYLVLFFLTRIIVSAASNQPIIPNLILVVPQQISMGLFIFKAITNNIKKQHTWKGRNIS